MDTWTGQVRTARAVMGSDCGTVINPVMAAGQLEGGLSKGVGFALYEGNEWDADGQLTSKGLLDRRQDARQSAKALALMICRVYFADTYEPSGPFGAKGIGEAATNPVAAAYANAIYNAIGVRFYELPITPEKVLRALRRRQVRVQCNEMTNTHILVQEFEYLEPASLAEALSLLSEYGDRAQVLAGGTNLLVWMKMEQRAPEYVINIGKLPGLAGISSQDDRLEHRRAHHDPRAPQRSAGASRLHRAGRGVRGLRLDADPDDGHIGRKPVQRLARVRHGARADGVRRATDARWPGR